MPDFKVTSETITQISNIFGIPENEVNTLHSTYMKKISRLMKRHYLAHVIRTMEETLRELPNNEMFRIICTPVAEDSKNIGIASSHYYKGRFFAIYYHPNTKEKQLRIMLAHELGHLFLIELVNTSFGFNYDAKTQIEPISTIMGIFTIFDKNEFYYNNTTPFKHDSPEEVLHDFQLLHNRDHGINNLS
jgi:hypothetical protein